MYYQVFSIRKSSDRFSIIAISGNITHKRNWSNSEITIGLLQIVHIEIYKWNWLNKYSWANSDDEPFTSVIYLFELSGGSKSFVMSICSSPEDIILIVESSDDTSSTAFVSFILSITTSAEN